MAGENGEHYPPSTELPEDDHGFFRGLRSIPIRIAYVLTALSFVAAPIQMFAFTKPVALPALVFSSAVTVYCLGVSLVCKPRGEGLPVFFYSLFALGLHTTMHDSPAF